MPWDPVVLSRIRRLHLHARRLSDALRGGDHRSRRIGQAIEFADYVPYQAGMNLRQLDWKVRARTDRWVVRRHHTDHELPCHLVVDVSADLGTGRTAERAYPPLEGTKMGFALTLAATLAMWWIHRGERIGLRLLGSDDGSTRVVPARTGRRHLQAILRNLASARPGPRAELGQGLMGAARTMRERGLAIVVTDGMEEPSGWLGALTGFRQRGVDARLVHVLDQQELDLSYPSAAIFTGPEDGSRLPLDPVAARPVYEEVLGTYLEEVRRGVLSAGMTYHRAVSADPMVPLLHRLIRGIE